MQFPPMPKKPIISQVVPLGTCSTGCDGTNVRRIEGVLCEGWMDPG